MSLFVCFFCYRSGDGPGWHVGIGHEIEAAQAQNILANPVVNSTVGQIESGRTFDKYLQCAERFFLGGLPAKCSRLRDEPQHTRVPGLALCRADSVSLLLEAP